jgi:hypothetical protein
MLEDEGAFHLRSTSFKAIFLPQAQRSSSVISYQSHLIQGFSCWNHWVNILLRIDHEIDDDGFRD